MQETFFVGNSIEFIYVTTCIHDEIKRNFVRLYSRN